jgi:predicted glycoside hydrolase/deacetylase ChbG (UPF0249 family)
MEVDLKLQESLQVATTNFTERIKKVLEEMRNKTSAYIQEVNQEMEQFAVALKVYANQEYDRLNHMEDDVGEEGNNFHDEILEIMGDPDTLNQTLETSKEAIDAKVNEVESLIIKELNADWKATETRIIDQQHHRNRTIVKEVVKTCENFKKEISKYYLVEVTFI